MFQTENLNPEELKEFKRIDKFFNFLTGEVLKVEKGANPELVKKLIIKRIFNV